MRRWVLLGMAVLALAGWATSSATARVAHYEITISVSGPGHVRGNGDGGSFDCPENCSAMIRERTLLTLTATSDNDRVQFTGWGGACVEYRTDSTCELQISGPKDVTAGFGTPPPPPPPKATLTVSKTGSGSGYVGGNGGIDCGHVCVAAVSPGTPVTLIPVADDGSDFVGWSAAGCSGKDTCTLTVAADTTVTARFDHVDRAPPRIRTSPASAARGTTALLRFRVYDDSGESRELLTVRKGTATIARIRVPMSKVRYGRVYSTRWRVPRSLAPGVQRYCAVATDAAGNQSKRSCSALRIR